MTSATEKTLDVGEYSINLATGGKGPHIVMLHGMDKRESWRVWEPLLPLGDSFSLVIPDLVGYGKSTRPDETPDYRAQARVVNEVMERLSIQKAALMGVSWGGQVALEVAINWPERVGSVVLISGTYDKSQIPKMGKVRRPTLIIWAEDDLVTQLKAGYVLRDSIGTSRLEVLEPVAKDPRHDFTIAHRLERFRTEVVIKTVREFLSSPSQKVVEPPELEPELKGMAMKQESEKRAST